MKLQLKHIAPYLPYELKAVKGITRIKLTAVNLELLQIYHTSYLGSRLRVVSDINSIKPILRPLSDLTKEIEVDGEKFVPIERMFNEEYPANKSKSFYYDTQINYIRCSHNNTSYHKMIYTNSELINRNNYGDMQNLFEWHFDVFGLIENGLAIDVNTLKG